MFNDRVHHGKSCPCGKKVGALFDWSTTPTKAAGKGWWTATKGSWQPPNEERPNEGTSERDAFQKLMDMFGGKPEVAELLAKVGPQYLGKGRQQDNFAETQEAYHKVSIVYRQFGHKKNKLEQRISHLVAQLDEAKAELLEVKVQFGKTEIENNELYKKYTEAVSRSGLGETGQQRKEQVEKDQKVGQDCIMGAQAPALQGTLAETADKAKVRAEARREAARLLEVELLELDVQEQTAHAELAAGMSEAHSELLEAWKSSQAKWDKAVTASEVANVIAARRSLEAQEAEEEGRGGTTTP